jgi:HAE1 family hydrophobic/amphiphilic exporter-1
VAGRFNGAPSAVIAAYQLPGSNAVDAAAGVQKLMTQMKQRFPEDLDFVIALDTTRSVTQGIKEIVIMQSVFRPAALRRIAIV